MLILLLSVFLAGSAEALPDLNCVSVNCDLYRAEHGKFQQKVAKIGCQPENPNFDKECDHDKLVILTKEMEDKATAIFASPNVPPSIRNDVHFNSMTNAFAAGTQNAPNQYEIVPVLSSPNIGVHWGGITSSNMAQVDKIVNIDPASSPVASSNWYLTQWKKTAPLMLSATRKDPIITNSGYNDGYLGNPAFEINSPASRWGTETSLLIFRHQASQSNVFEIVGRNGWHNAVGGSNVFLSSPVTDTTNNVFTNELNLTLNKKISRYNIKYLDNSSDTINLAVVGQAFAAFTALYTQPNGQATNLFVQIGFADVRGGSVYAGCYKNGNNPEIVYTGNIDGDFQTKADAPNAPLQPKKYNLNKYLCHALKQNYNCPSDIPKPDFKSWAKDLKNWRLTSFYTGVETQATSVGATTNEPGPVKGDVELGVQYSNMRIMADAGKQFATCDDVENGPTPVDPTTPVSPECKKGTFKADNGNIIEFSCGCGVVAGGTLQAGGCYHKDTGKKDAVLPPPSESKCTSGTFKDSENQTVEWKCNCGPVSGGTDVGDGCYHKVKAQTPPPAEENKCTRGTFKNDDNKTVEWKCNCGPVAGGVNVGDGCYHKIID